MNTPAENERLFILAEELGEALQCVGKIGRHGFCSYNPYDAAKIPNKEHLERELGDVLAIIRYMVDCEDIDEGAIDRYAANKLDKFKFGLAYLHYQGEE